METKPLFIVAGGTDGYTGFFYTFSQEVYLKFYCSQDYAWQGDVSVIQVPIESSYESLCIKTIIENCCI